MDDLNNLKFITDLAKKALEDARELNKRQEHDRFIVTAAYIRGLYTAHPAGQYYAPHVPDYLSILPRRPMPRSVEALEDMVTMMERYSPII